MVEKEFDFKNIGKQMPYRTPEGFFDKMQQRVVEQTQNEKRKKQQPRMKLIIAATLAAAAMLLGVIFFPATQTETEQLPSHSFIVSAEVDYPYSDVIDQYIEHMSDEELEEWIELSDNDIFMN
ncbi:hypothetical protein [Phocaeicola sp.]